MVENDPTTPVKVDKTTEDAPVVELQAEQEKQTFIESLPVNNKGEIDQKKMTAAQTMQNHGVDETLKAEQQVKNKEKQLKNSRNSTKQRSL